MTDSQAVTASIGIASAGNGNTFNVATMNFGATVGELVKYGLMIANAEAAQADAEEFIREMAQQVAGEKALDLDGMKTVVRTAIGIYKKEGASGMPQSSTSDIVARALLVAGVKFDIYMIELTDGLTDLVDDFARYAIAYQRAAAEHATAVSVAIIQHAEEFRREVEERASAVSKAVEGIADWIARRW